MTAITIKTVIDKIETINTVTNENKSKFIQDTVAMISNAHLSKDEELQLYNVVTDKWRDLHFSKSDNTKAQIKTLATFKGILEGNKLEDVTAQIEAKEQDAIRELKMLEAKKNKKI